MFGQSGVERIVFVGRVHLEQVFRRTHVSLLVLNYSFFKILFNILFIKVILEVVCGFPIGVNG